MLNLNIFREKIKNNIVLSVVIGSVAFITSSIIIGKAVKNTFLIRTLTVKGAAERTVKADFAIWSIDIEEKDRDLIKAQNKMEQKLKILKAHLLEKGFKEEELTNNSTQMNEIREERESKDSFKYITEYKMSSGFVVKSGDVNLVDKVYTNIAELIKKGVKIKYSYDGNAPRYLFKKFDIVKDEMIKEATKNALRTAKSFASDAGDKIRGIKTANQGVFQISPEIANKKWDDEASYIDKNIRIVTTITYILD